jgi:hypothetical protein
MACTGVCTAQTLAADLAWAYAITPGPAPAAPRDDGTRFALPGTDRTFTLDQIRNRLGPADWFPGDHPSMPSIVAVGREGGAIWDARCAITRTARAVRRMRASRACRKTTCPANARLQERSPRCVEPQGEYGLDDRFAHAMTDADT